MPPDFEQKNRMKNPLVDGSAIIAGDREIVRTGFYRKIGSSDFCAPGNTICADSEDILKRRQDTAWKYCVHFKEFPAQVEIRDIAVENIRDVGGEVDCVGEENQLSHSCGWLPSKPGCQPAGISFCLISQIR